jgi:hypothetical protein
MSKLLQDNGILNIDQPVLSRQVFTWDETLVEDQQLNASFAASGTIYATDISNYGNVYSVVQRNGGQPVSPPPGQPYTPPSPSNNYQMVLSTFYTSGADGTTSMTLTDVNSNPIIGYQILQIEDEIRPLKPSQFTFNPANAQLVLLGGLALDAGQTLFILYYIIV